MRSYANLDGLSFDEYRSNVPHESEEWATSNRGWAWSAANDKTCFAHYLEYSRGQQGKRIHVCIVGRGVVWVRTCADARLAIRAAFRRACREGR